MELKIFRTPLIGKTVLPFLREICYTYSAFLRETGKKGGGPMEFVNDPIARRIREAAGRGTLSHALLFSGSGDRIAAAQYAAAAM